MASIDTEPGRPGRLPTAAGERSALGVQLRALAAGPLTTWLSGLTAAIPVIAATVQGLRDGATATGDRAIILTRSFDVLSAHTPLVGQYSASSLLYQHIVHSLGPLLYWLEAIPVRIDASVAPAVAIGLMNVLMILGAVTLARRRGGIALMAMAAVALALMCASLSAETFHDVWNPSVGLLPLTLLIFVSWSLACGEHRLLPLAVLLASFTAQSELVFLVPSAGALVLGLAGLLTLRQGRASAWRWWLAALIVGLLCWSAPIVDELTGHPGNLTLVAEAALSHGHTVGATSGWRAVVRAVGVRPWWLTPVGDPFDRLADIRSAPSTLALVSTIALLGGLVGVVALGAVRRRWTLVWAAAIALVLCLSLYGTTASMSARPSLEKSLGYMLWIGSPIGMWVWLTLASSALGAPLAAVARRLRRRGALDAWPARLASRLASVALIALVGAVVAAGQGRDQDLSEYAPVKAVQAAVRRALAHGPRTVLVTGSHSFTAFDFRAAVIYDLRRRGLRVFAPAASQRLGSYYEPPRGRSFTTIWIFDEAHPARRGRVIERLRLGAPAKTITVMISSASPRRS